MIPLLASVAEAVVATSGDGNASFGAVSVDEPVPLPLSAIHPGRPVQPTVAVLIIPFSEWAIPSVGSGMWQIMT